MNHVGAYASAVISGCGRYRYRLTRRISAGLFGSGGRAVWIMLNPSTADATHDDPTVRRCLGFTQRAGLGELEIVNLFAYRATNPEELKKPVAPIGPDNDHHIVDAVCGADLVIAAWGANGDLFGRDLAARKLVASIGADMHALAFTVHGLPRHPLMLSYKHSPTPWPLPRP